MKSKIKRYFLASYTGKGFVNFFDETIEALDYIYVLQGVPGNGVTSLLKNISTYFIDKGEPIDFIHRPTKADALDGLIFKTRRIGILKSAAPTMFEPTLPYINGELVDLTKAIQTSRIKKHKEKLYQFKQQQTENYEQYTKSRIEMHSLHDQVETFYSGQLDIPAANKLALDVIDTIFGNKTEYKASNVEKRFFEANRNSEKVDFLMELTKGCHVRYFIKGGPGTGKSVLMKNISAAAIERGFDIEHYHCGLDPDSLDLIILPELGFAAFDSTPPHERKPSQPGDQVIDMSSLLKADPYEIYRKEIDQINLVSREISEKSKNYLDKAEKAEKAISDLYDRTVNLKKIQEVEQYLIEQIMNNHQASI